MNRHDSHIEIAVEEMIWPDGSLALKLARLQRTKKTCEGCEAKDDSVERKAAYYLQYGFKIRYYYCEECAKEIAAKLGMPLEEIISDQVDPYRNATRF